jgi:lipopolysaccharide export system ATP-binding protein
VTTILAAECMAKSFGARRVLSSASLRAVAGRMLALVGRNGAGKSTLLKIAAGWIQPDGGSIQVRGRAYLQPSLPQLARDGVFYLPDHDLLSPAFPVGAQLEMFARQFGQGDPAEAATLLGIGSLLDRKPRSLSGGELRRAELAAAVARGPACLLADEPYRGIAPLDVEVLTRALRHLADRGCAVVFTGHEIQSVLAACDRVTWCMGGTTIDLGTPEAAMRDERFQREYLGPTLSARVMQAKAEPGRVRNG